MKSKFVELVGESYKLIKGFIPAEECDAYANVFREECEEEYCNPCPTAGACRGTHQHPPAMLYLVNKNQELSDILGDFLLPTYAYTRSYGPGGFLLPHTDRDACEVSVTVHLDADTEWDFQIYNVEGELVTLTLEKGDALVFDGKNFKHNRVETYAGEEYTQLFLHYVFANGNYPKEIFDYNNLSKTHTDRTDFIWHMPGYLEHSECDGIVNAANIIDKWSPAGTVGEEKAGESNYRVCDTLPTGPHKELDQILYGHVVKAIQQYCTTYQHLDITIDEGYNILRYSPGGQYKVHTDQGANNNRAITIIFNLNDDYEGGGLSFFNDNYHVQLKKGDCIIFPSSFIYDHIIHPITEGTRYSMVTWAV